MFGDLLARGLERGARELLQLGNLLVQVRNVLLDNVRELLRNQAMLMVSMGARQACGRIWQGGVGASFEC